MLQYMVQFFVAKPVQCSVTGNGLEHNFVLPTPMAILGKIC